MSKTTQETTRTQEIKEPKTIAVREAVPWLIVAIMAFAIAGLITGWTLRSEVAVSQQSAVAVASKAVAR
ncbi:hypothetical protein ABIB48_002616 [Arthrobacter sp. UYCu511]|uniref:hypothetical protein n=1 Tax=Arthrobacter sp. UYCu511 TaxID=3156337 RepID=UPI003397A32B